jgi:uncharacterized membrane protein
VCHRLQFSSRYCMGIPDPALTATSPRVNHIQFSMVNSIDLITLLVTGLMVGNEFAVAAFVHPAINKLDETCHSRAASVIAAVLGKLMPIWYALGLLLILVELWLHRPLGLNGNGALIVAAILWALTIIATILFMVPINNRIAAIQSSGIYSGWLNDRKRWDTLHRIRVVVLAVTFALLLVALVPRS